MPVWAQIVSAVIATAGFGLGVYNAWFAYRRDATRLTVIPSIRETAKGIVFDVKVRNVGNTPLYIERMFLTGRTSGEPAFWGLNPFHDIRKPPYVEPIPIRDAKTFSVGVNTLAKAMRRKMFVVNVESKDGTIGRARCKELPLFADALIALDEKRQAIEHERKNR